jgi:hypothetical protein
MLLISQICEKYSISLDELGFDGGDPRVYLEMVIASNVYEAAVDQKRYKKMSHSSKKGSKPKAPVWEKDNPEAARLLSWAAKDESAIKSSDQPQLPVRKE